MAATRVMILALLAVGGLHHAALGARMYSLKTTSASAAQTVRATEIADQSNNNTVLAAFGIAPDSFHAQLRVDPDTSIFRSALLRSLSTDEESQLSAQDDLMVLAPNNQAFSGSLIEQLGNASLEDLRAWVLQHITARDGASKAALLQVGQGWVVSSPAESSQVKVISKVAAPFVKDVSGSLVATKQQVQRKGATHGPFCCPPGRSECGCPVGSCSLCLPCDTDGRGRGCRQATWAGGLCCA